MRTFHIILGVADLIAFVGFLINPEAWGDIFAVLFVFTVIMLISFGIVILSYDEDDYEYPEAHPFLRDFRKRHEDDSD
ncbi:hypothetical protein [Phocaeicola plebeius]|uniref:hypothetical protein n=1 Tax=Phocaeicola plebeius TaxID=310297 RepID=UPI003522E787